MTIKVAMKDWEVTLKDSILSVYYDNIDIQNNQEKSTTDLLIKALSIQRKTNYRKGKKQVFLSKEILENSLFPQFCNAINTIKCNFENGKYEQKFQRLSKYHHENSLYGDTMLDVLNVEHFHLGDDAENSYRSKELLFVKYTDNGVYFIDIFHHRNFLDDTIIKILHDNWEDIISEFKFPPMIQYSTNIENKNRYSLYKKNINSMYKITDKHGHKHCYATHGVMSNGEAMQDVNYAMFLQRKIEHFQINIDYFTNLIYQNLLQNFHKSFAELNFSVVWLADFGVCFTEINSKTYFVLQENEIIFLKRRVSNE